MPLRRGFRERGAAEDGPKMGCEDRSYSCADPKVADAPEQQQPNDGDDDSWRGRVDLDGLLVALVLVPHSYARNRFFSMYRWPAAREVRRRAALLRSLIADLSCDAESLVLRRSGPELTLSFDRPAFDARRRTRLSARELALVAQVLERADLPASRLTQLAVLFEAVEPAAAASAMASLAGLLPRPDEDPG